MCIVGNLELSKDVLHKQSNFIVAGTEHQSSKTIYSGKNYAISFLKSILKKGVALKEGIRELEDRFLPDDEKDLLLIVLDSVESKNPTKIQMRAPKKKAQIKDVQLIVETNEAPIESSVP